jgi:ribonuclease HI
MNTPEFSGLVYIYADESCLGNQFGDRRNPGGAAGLIEVFDEKRGWIRRDYFVWEPDTTNQRMALRSGSEGLSSLSKPCNVVFYSDSNYLVRGMKEWVHAWARRGWKRKAGPIENLELWIALTDAARPHTVEWRWVRGHAGHPKNEYANKLAVDAARSRKTSHGLKDSEFDAWLQAQQEKDRFLDFLDLPPQEEYRPDPRPPTPPLL